MGFIKTFFFLFSTILFVTLLPQAVTCQALVDQVCQHSHNQPNCLSSFASNADSKNATLKQLGVIALQIASNSSIATSLYIQKLLNGTNLNPAVQQSLDDCFDDYIDANDQLVDSVAALLGDKYQDVRTWVNAAISDAKACEDGFTQNGAKTFPLRKNNVNFRQLCNNVLIVTKLLDHTISN